jgi:hypothetical protein
MKSLPDIGIPEHRIWHLLEMHIDSTAPVGFKPAGAIDQEGLEESGVIG